MHGAVFGLALAAATQTCYRARFVSSASFRRGGSRRTLASDIRCQVHGLQAVRQKKNQALTFVSVLVHTHAIYEP